MVITNLVVNIVGLLILVGCSFLRIFLKHQNVKFLFCAGRGGGFNTVLQISFVPLKKSFLSEDSSLLKSKKL